MALADLKPAPYNDQVRTISRRNFRGLTGSIERWGLLQDIVWNKRTGHIVGGEKRARVLRRKRVKETEVIVVDLPLEEEKILNATLNSPSVAGEFTDGIGAMLEEAQASLPDLYDNLNLADLIEPPPSHPKSAPGFGRSRAIDVDSIPEVPQAKAREGDLWILGRHRLLCADALNPENVDRVTPKKRVDLFLTDTPYAIYGSSSGIASDVADDAMVRPFFERILRLAYERLPWFGHAYMCCDWRSWPAIWEAAKIARMQPKNLIVWNKGGGGFGSNYQNTYEFVGFFAKMPPEKTMRSQNPPGQRLISGPNLITIPRPHGDERWTNAAKPVALFETLIENSTDEGGTVFDPCVGSGTTIIAAERLGRSCVAVDKSPNEIDKAVARWEKVTGGKAEHKPRSSA